MRRPRLVSLGATGRLVMVEAPSGAGKSTLLAQMADDHDGPLLRATLSGGSATRGQLLSRLRGSLRQSGLSDLATALARDDQVDLVDDLLRWSEPHGERMLLQVDDVHLADDELDRYLAELCDRWPRPHRIVLAGRRIPPRIRRASLEADSVIIDSDELRFRPEETREVLGDAVTGWLDDADVDSITRSCEGWAAAVGLAGDRLRRVASDTEQVVRGAAELSSRPSTVTDLLRALLELASPQARAAVGKLMLLPALDDHLVQAAGIDGGLAELVDLGLPLEDAGHGFRGFTNVVRDALQAAEPDAALAQLAAQHYLEVARPDAALEVLAAAGLDEQLARLLATFPPHLSSRLDMREHAASVASLPHELLVAHPGIMVTLADRYTLAGHMKAYAETLARAEALLVEGGRYDDDHDPEALEVRAAVLAHRAVARNDDSLVDQAQQLLANPDLSPLANARLTGVIGRAIASRRTAAALQTGARLLDEAAQAYDRAQNPLYALATRVIAATVALLPLGRYDLALQQLDQALSVARGIGNLRVAILPYRAFALIDLGRYAEAEGHLRELRRTANTAGAGNERAAAYARWAAAQMASQQGDAETTWAAIRAVERSDVAVDTGNGAFFRADAARLLARVGWFDDAHRLLAEARERDDGTTNLVAIGDFVVAAHAGDRPRAEQALERLDGGRTVEPRDRWRISLLHAHLCHRAGDPLAAPLAAAAFEEASQLGYADLPMIQESQIARTLLQVAAQGSASARDAMTALGARLRLLGGLEVEVAGQRTEPTGRPAQLLAYLALHDGQAAADALIEALWPDTDAARGRERLRTVLRRLRRDHGDLVERHDDLIRLRTEVTVDVHEFLRFCRQATDATTDREGAAAAALALYRGEPVPSLAHLGWVARGSRHLHEQVLAMYDVVADRATEQGRLDDAIRALLAALELDPVAEGRYLAAARLLAEQGRRTRALRLLAEAREALADADLEPSPELARLEGYLSRNPVVDVPRSSA